MLFGFCLFGCIFIVNVIAIVFVAWVNLDPNRKINERHAPFYIHMYYKSNIFYIKVAHA